VWPQTHSYVSSRSAEFRHESPQKASLLIGAVTSQLQGSFAQWTV
jgi:hypothetical protein